MTAEQEKERQFYISQIFNAQEDERQHITRELHDETLHPFYVFLNYAHPPLLQRVHVIQHYEKQSGRHSKS